MGIETSTTASERLLRELIEGLSSTGPREQVSLGVVGCPTCAPQPPGHCLHECLNGDTESIRSRGCPFLVAAARGSIEPALLRDGLCQRGYRVQAQPASLGTESVTLLSVGGEPGAQPVAGSGSEMLRRLDSAGRLVQHVGQLLEENTGFANEVLQNYEQLNLIFDLTQQITQVTDTEGIERLLAQRVGRLVESDVVCVVTSEGECRTYGRAEGPGRGFSAAPPVDLAEIAPSVKRVRRQRQVQVARADGQHVLAGPLVRLGDKVDVVLAVHDAEQGQFSSGNMMLLESILTFGGQIISNTELHERMRRMSLEVTRAMVAAIDKKDEYTSGHSERGGFLTRLTARELGISPAEQQNMEWAGLLHDVGKIGIPEEILCKPGRLTPEEFEVIKRHPQMGYDILKPIASFETVLDGVLYHHEYPDGTGYPKGLKGDEIPLVARIIHVVDTFDAVTSMRSYRHPFTVEKALSIIRQDMGTRVDAEAAEAFFRAFEAYRRNDPEDYAARFPHIKEAADVVS
jgi:HD-GYP domain-containing protein (c-di-GMP phosphodiesterase class II)